MVLKINGGDITAETIGALLSNLVALAGCCEGAVSMLGVSTILKHHGRCFSSNASIIMKRMEVLMYGMICYMQLHPTHLPVMFVRLIPVGWEQIHRNV